MLAVMNKLKYDDEYNFENEVSVQSLIRFLVLVCANKVFTV